MVEPFSGNGESAYRLMGYQPFLVGGNWRVAESYRDSGDLHLRASCRLLLGSSVRGGEWPHAEWDFLERKQNGEQYLLKEYDSNYDFIFY